MRHRLLGALGARVAVIAVVSLASLPATAQPQTAVADRASRARTPWGDPDLQGIWNNFTITPLERPEALADQEFLSPEEAAALEQRAVDRFDRLNAPSVRTGSLPVGGNVGAYNSFWTEQGTRVVQTRRTSLIVDPPDGRLPPLIPEAHTRITSPEALRLRDVRQGDIPADGPEDLGLSERCLWYRGIPSFPTGYNNNYHILQTPDYVVIFRSISTTCASSPWTGVCISRRSFVNMRGIHVAVGKARRSSSRPSISKARLSDGGTVRNTRWAEAISVRPYR